MPNLLQARALFAVLLCLGPVAALAQDNPWRVPSYREEGWANPGSTPQRNGGGWSSGSNSNDRWSEGYNGNGSSGQKRDGGQNGGYRGGNSYAGSQGTGEYGGSRWSSPDAQGTPPGTWERGQGARIQGDADYHASLQRQPQTRGYDAPNGPASSGWRQNRDYSGGYTSPGYSVPATVPPPYLYGRQYGEFPPLEGEQRMPGAERRQPQPAPQPLPPPRPAAPQAYGYGSTYGNTYGNANGNTYGNSYGNANGNAYGNAYGNTYGNGLYPDPALGGPSTLGNPYGYGSAYGTPYGTPVPGPYGW